MAERLLQAHKVSDLCIGKPALRWLPPQSTVADAIADLEAGGGGGGDAAVAVWDGSEGSDVAGRVCMADALLFLCADAAHLASPAAALQATLSDLLAAGALQPVRRIDPDASVLEAVEAFLGGAHTLAVPIRERWRAAADRGKLCWLTVEDVVRFLLSSVGVFSATASRSVTELGAVRPAALAVAAGDSALSTVPLLRAALASHASVAVVAGTGTGFPARRLVGEISPSALCSGGVASVAAIAALSAGQLVSFLDWGGAPPAATLHAVRSRLRRRNLLGMLDLLYGGTTDASSSSSSSSSASSSSSSSSDEDEDIVDANGRKLIIASPHRHGSSFLGRRRAEEATVCHRGSSLVAVMVQAMVHRATHVWVVEEQELVGVVGLLDVLRVLRRHLVAGSGCGMHPDLD
ncbi:CBS domain-containing protein CBSX5-like [Miscanthus floridulus]|uniref:CBS domain-containing protein CBSX5-like n=1 Tax=Miscanthus floridulus TaxID=154761 RepID=UPI0034575BAE